jgi:hypothetical protein
VSKVSYGSRTGRIRSTTTKDIINKARSPEEVVRQLKEEQAKLPGEDYRERALAMYGLICARCAREFDSAHRQLLTVHHKDGNHNNNPPDGSNWEPLCVYCHEDVHSREILSDYMNGTAGGRESSLVYRDETTTAWGSLGDKLKKSLENKTKSRS